MIINLTGDARDRIAFNVEFSRFILKSGDFQNDFPTVGRRYPSTEEAPQGFDIMRMMHSMNPENIREAMIYYFENHVMESAPSRNGAYHIPTSERVCKVAYPLQLAHYLDDKILIADITKLLLSNSKFDPLFKWHQRMLGNAKTIFLFSPPEYLKEVFLKIKKDIYASSPHSKLRRMIFADFIYTLISIKKELYGSRHDRMYEEFFMKNFTAKEREDFLDLMKSHLGNYRIVEYWDILHSMPKFSPTTKERFKTSFMQKINESSYKTIQTNHYLDFLDSSVKNETKEIIKKKVLEGVAKLSYQDMIRDPFPFEGYFKYTTKDDKQFKHQLMVKICRDATKNNITIDWLKANINSEEAESMVEHYMNRYANLGEG